MFSNIYPEFHQLYPQVHIDPMELSVHDQNPLLLSGQLDIGFMTLFESQEKKGLEYLRITKESLVLAVPSDLAQTDGSGMAHFQLLIQPPTTIRFSFQSAI